MDVRKNIFRLRGYTPIPLALAILYLSGKEWTFLLPGIFIILIGELIRFNGVRYAGGATRTRNVGAKTLCTSGPFSRVRNPLYLGNMLIYLGIVLLADGQYVWIMFVITLLFFSLQYGLIISLEEQTLSGLFGAEYQMYKENVPQLIPRLTPWRGGTKTDPKSWLATLKTERGTLLTLITFVILLFIKKQFFS